MSLASTPGAVTFSGVSSLVEATSSIATGASFTALTVIVTVARFEVVGPVVRLVGELSVPLKFAAGV